MDPLSAYGRNPFFHRHGAPNNNTSRFTRPQQPDLTQIFQRAPDARDPRWPAWRPGSQVNHMPNPAGYGRNPFQVRSPYADVDERYARAQKALYGRRPALIFRPEPLHPPLVRAGDAGTAEVSDPPLFGPPAVRVFRFGTFTLLPAFWTAAALILWFLVVACILWWGVVTAANVYCASAEAKRSASYYVLGKTPLFLGAVTPLAGTSAGEPPGVTLITVENWAPGEAAIRIVTAVKDLAVYIAPPLAGKTAVVIDVADDITNGVVSFDACAVDSAEIGPYPLHKQALGATETVAKIVVNTLAPWLPGTDCVAAIRDEQTMTASSQPRPIMKK